MKDVKCLVFDLDGTLYDIDNGYMKRIRENIFTMMQKKGYAASREEAERLWKPLFKQYNQSFRGLNAGGFTFTADEYWEEHRAGMQDFFTPDEPLRELLSTLLYPKVIFTNCREKEATEILKLMGIEECFTSVYGSDFMGEICKPQKECFELVLDSLGHAPHEVLYFEDSIKNLRTAQELGMHCVLINSETANEEGGEIEIVDEATHRGLLPGFSAPIVVLDTLNDGGLQLRRALPHLFERA
jgi:pyrimidine 5'-nucleotidase